MKARTAVTAALLATALAAQAQQLQQAGEQARLGRKTIALSSFVGDRKCETPVAPFELTSNFGELTLLAAKYGATRLLGQFIGQPAPAGIPSEIKTAAVRMNWLPMAAEVAYGEYQLKLMQDEEVILKRGAASERQYEVADRLLAATLAQIPDAHPYQFQVFVRKINEGNALALPGGFVMLDSDLVTDPAKYPRAALAMAHEVAHVLRRHETKAIQARIVDAVSLAGGTGDLIKQLTDIARAPSTVVAVLATGKLQFERHKMDQELQADACSVRIAQAALADDQLLLKALNDFVATLPSDDTQTKLDRINLDMDQVGELMSRSVDRHPGGTERSQWFSAILKELHDAGVFMPKLATQTAAPQTNPRPARTLARPESTTRKKSP